MKSSRLKKFIEEPISKKTFFVFLLIAILQIALAAEPAAVIFFIPEVILTPITFYVITAFIIGRINLKWPAKKLYTIGYLIGLAIAFIGSVLIISNIEILSVFGSNLISSSFLSSNGIHQLVLPKILYALFLPLHLLATILPEWLTSLYNYGRFGAVALVFAIVVLILLPLFWGILVNIIYLVLPKKRKKLLIRIIIVIIILILTASAIGTFVQIKKYKANQTRCLFNSSGQCVVVPLDVYNEAMKEADLKKEELPITSNDVNSAYQNQITIAEPLEPDYPIIETDEYSNPEKGIRLKSELIGKIQDREEMLWIYLKDPNYVYSFSFGEAQSAEEFFETDEGHCSYCMKPVQKTVNDLTIIEYEDSGMCYIHHTVLIIGGKYNYSLSQCGDIDKREDNFERMGKIVEGIQLID